MPQLDLIQLRRGTAAEWTSANPILASAEPGYETDTGQIKYGDGVTAWVSLNYFNTIVDPATTLLGNPISALELHTLAGANSNVQIQIDRRQHILFESLPTINTTAFGPQLDIFMVGQASIGAGKCVYLDAAGAWQLTDANSLVQSSGFICITLEVAPMDDPIRVAMPGCLVRVNSWNWSSGATLYLSTTAGALTETPPSGTGNVVRSVGYAVDSDLLYFFPSPTYMTSAQWAKFKD